MSQTDSVAVGQGQISHLKSAGWRLRTLEFITVVKVHKILPQWYSPEHKPRCLGLPICPKCTFPRGLIAGSLRLYKRKMLEISGEQFAAERSGP